MAKKKAARPGRARGGWKAGVIAAVTTVLTGLLVAGLTKYLRFDTPLSAADPAGPPVKVDRVEPVHALDEVYVAFAKPPGLSPGELATDDDRGDTGKDYAWWRRHGGVDAGILDVRAILRGNAASQVQLLDASLSHVRCTRPSTGAIAFSPSAGDGEVRGIGFDLDSPRPYAQEIGRLGAFGKPYFGRRTVTLDRNEVEVFAFNVWSLTRDCRFLIDIEANVEGKTAHVVLTDHGRPFRVAGMRLEKDDVFAPHPGTRPKYLHRSRAPKFGAYQEVYAAGVAAPSGGGAWTRLCPGPHCTD